MKIKPDHSKDELTVKFNERDVVKIRFATVDGIDNCLLFEDPASNHPWGLNAEDAVEFAAWLRARIDAQRVGA